MSGAGRDDAGAPIVSVVFNDTEFDSRVRGIATALARHGREVVLLGIVDGEGREDRLGLVSRRVLARPGPSGASYRWPMALAERLQSAREGSQRGRAVRMAQLKEAAKGARRDARRVARKGEGATAAARAAAGVEATERRLRRARRRGAPRRRGERALRRIERRLRRRTRRAELRERARTDPRLLTRAVVELAPAAIHANDADGLSVAVAAAEELERAGPRPRIVYDAHEWTVGRRDYLRPAPGRRSEVELEGAAIEKADAVITVSEPLADLLQTRYSLRERPQVVFSAPPGADEAAREPAPGIRELTGVPRQARLLVYAGRIAERRGVLDAIRALRHLPAEFHFALLGRASPALARQVRATAEAERVEARVHLVEPVAPEDVVAALRDADVGLLPLHRNEQHRVTMPTKLFQYAQAGLPVVASDCGPYSRSVEELGIGTVFAAGDASALAAAVGRAVAGRERFRDRLATPGVRWLTSWEASEPVLIELYRRLGVLAAPSAERSEPGRGIRLGIGPRNGNGQAWEWARAVERSIPAASAQSFATEFPSGPLDLSFPCDLSISRAEWTSLARQAERVPRVLNEYTHLLIEQGISVFGGKLGDFSREIALLRGSGVEVALCLRGSEVRDPDRHAAREPFSPFRDGFDAELLEGLRGRSREIRGLIESHGLPAFVTTTDLLEELPGASWIPLVVSTAEWEPGEPVPAGSPARVLHAPPREWTKGSAFVDAVCEPLQAEGEISYRRLRGVPYRRMHAELARADIVVDQLVMGSHGMLGLQAMACERVVVSYISESTRRHLPQGLPIVSATPETLRAVLLELVGDPREMRRLGLAGRAYVERHHTGAAAAAALRPWLLGGSRQGSGGGHRSGSG